MRPSQGSRHGLIRPSYSQQPGGAWWPLEESPAGQALARLEHAGIPAGAGAGAYEEAILGGAAPGPLPLGGEDLDALAGLGGVMESVAADIVSTFQSEDELPEALREVERLGEALNHPRCTFPYFARLSAACVAREQVGQGQIFYYHIPEKPRGHVILMHGGGVGRAEDWFVRINRLNFAKILIQQGFAVSAYQSLSQWNPRTFRADRRNIEDVSAKMRARGARGPAGEELPEFAVCVSMGCRFLSWYGKQRASEGRPLAAQYYSMPWGMPDSDLHRDLRHTAPTFVAVGKNDDVPFTNTPASMDRFVQALRADGKDARLVVNPKSVCGECFHNLCKMPGVGLNSTRALVRGLKDRGILDEQGKVAVLLPNRQGVANPYEALIMEAYLNVDAFVDWPLFSVSGPMVDWIYQELSELEGAHRHTSDFDKPAVRFFLAHLPPRPSD